MPDGSTILGKEPAAKGSPAARAKPEFKEGDKIVAVRRRERDNRANNDYPKQKIGDYLGLQEVQRKFADRPLEYYVQRSDAANPKAEPSELQIVVEPNRMHITGLVMAIGPIAEIQKGSPAEQAGFRKGDRILAVDGKRDFDPLRIGELLNRTDRVVKIEVERGGATTEINVTPRSPLNFILAAENGPAGCDELGIAYMVLNTVQSVEPGSPADGKILPGDEITSVKVPPADDEEKDKFKKTLDEPIVLDAKTHNWPYIHSLFQALPSGHKVELGWTHGSEKKQAVLETAEAKEWFNPDRGLVVKTLSDIRQVDSWGQALGLGLRDEGVGVAGDDHAAEVVPRRPFAFGFWRTDHDCQGRRRDGFRRNHTLADLPDAVERELGCAQFPSDSGARRRAHDVSALRRDSRQAGQREDDDGADLRRTDFHPRTDGLRARHGYLPAVFVSGRRCASALFCSTPSAH